MAVAQPVRLSRTGPGAARKMEMENERSRDAVDYQGLLKEISALSTQFDLFRLLKKVTDRYGMRAFMVMRLPGATTQTLQSASIISSWPAELISRFDQAGMIANSPIAARLRHSTLPFAIDLAAEAGRDARSETLFELFDPFGMARLAFFPVCEPSGERGAVSIYGDRPILDDQEMLELLMISTHLFDRLHEIGRRDVKPTDELTEREIDCLNWTAAGKTSAEISEILGLSEHTVNHYLNRATRKLDTVNRTQAVAKALRTGIIS